MANNEERFKQIIAHAKEYGFIFPSSEIYDGLSAVYDYGQNGVELKNNIKQYWWKSMVQYHENIVGLDSCIFMHPTIWKASGHVDAFNDPLIDNKDSKKRYRADVLIEDHIAKIEEKINKEVEKARKRFENFDEKMFRETNGRVLQYQKQIDDITERFAALMNANDLAGLKALIEELGIVCPISGTRNWTDVRQFNLMFATKLGSVSEGADTIYLRPETAQGIFVNFLNVYKTGRMKLPFGIAQIGKAFRNEIVARQFIFRMREFEQMEMQFFVNSTTTRSWLTTPMPPPTLSSSSPSASKNWRASTPVPTSTSRSTRSSRARSSAISTPSSTRIMCRMSSRPPLAWTVCSWPCSAMPIQRRRWRMAPRVWC